MVDAYRAAGGIAEYRLLPSFGSEGHRLAEARTGTSAWGQILSDYTAKLH